jgi:hypothetical protein
LGLTRRAGWPGRHSRRIKRLGRGKHDSSIQLIAAAHEILEEIHPATVRAVCYRLFIGEIIPDMGKSSTQRVSTQLTWAREHRYIPWDWIVDETREAERVASWDDPADYMQAVRRSYRKDLWASQSHRVEVWSEKGTVRGTLLPVLNEYGVAFRVMHGFASATAVHEAAEESQVRGFTVLYVGDHDPSGMYMSEIDLPARLERYDADIDILRIALMRGDVDELPYFDLASKRSDARHDWYRGRYGNRCWELDAMNPVDLRQRVARMIKEIIDWPAWELAQRAENAEIATIDDVLAKWRQAISGPDPE